MKSGSFRVAIVLLLAVSACFAIVPLARAADSGTVILPWVPNNDPTGGLGRWYGRIEIQNPTATLCSIHNRQRNLDRKHPVYHRSARPRRSLTG